MAPVILSTALSAQLLICAAGERSAVSYVSFYSSSDAAYGPCPLFRKISLVQQIGAYWSCLPVFSVDARIDQVINWYLDRIR